MSDYPAIRKAMIDFDVDLHDAMMELAADNGRTLRAEVQHACRRHLEYRPKVKVEAAPLPSVEVEVPAKKPAKRGRPRKAE